jgi:hypothetical protein
VSQKSSYRLDTGESFPTQLFSSYADEAGRAPSRRAAKPCSSPAPGIVKKALNSNALRARSGFQPAGRRTPR